MFWRGKRVESCTPGKQSPRECDVVVQIVVSARMMFNFDELKLTVHGCAQNQSDGVEIGIQSVSTLTRLQISIANCNYNLLHMTFPGCYDK